MDNAPWKCQFCKKLRAANAAFCASCGTDWQTAMDQSYTHQPQKPQWNLQGWNYAPWQQAPTPWIKAANEERPRSNSPRSPRPPKRPLKNPKGKEKGGGKGKQTNAKGKGKGSMANQAERFPLPKEPDWKSQPVQEGGASASTTPPQTQDPKVQLLLGRLQKESSNFSPEIQNMIQDLQVQTSQQATKDLHAQVTRLGQAKKQLQLAIEARGRLHGSWQTYIADAIQRWEKNAEDFQSEETKIESDLTKARDNLLAAKESLEAAKLQATKFNLAVAQEEEGEDDAEMLASSLAGKRIHQNMTSLVTTLQEMHNQATEPEEPIERAPKAPRMESSETPPPPLAPAVQLATGGGLGDAVAASPQSLQPFGAPSRQTV